MNKALELILTIFFLFNINAFSQNAEIDSLETLLSKHKETDTVKIDLLNDIAFKLRFYDLQKTLQYAKHSDSLSNIVNYKKGKAVSLKIQGIYYASIPDYFNALGCYQKSIKICEEIGDKVTMASCYNNIGNIYRIQGNYPRALENYQKTLSLFEETGNEHYAAVCHLNIAILQGALGNKDKQIEGYLKAADYFNKVQDNRTLISVYTNIVSLYITVNNDSLALSYLKKLIPICKSLEDSEKLAISLVNYGVVEERFKNYDSAKQKYIEAISLSETINFKRGSFAAHYSLANFYFTHGDYNSALINILAAYEEVNDIGSLDEKKSTVELLSKIYEARNNYKKAHEYYVIFKTFTDSLYNESNIKEITNLENQYKFDKEKEAMAAEQAKKDALKEAELKRQRTVRNSLIIGFAIMIVFTLIIFRNLAKIRKANRLLASQKEEIASQKEEIQTQANELEIKNKNLLELSKFKKLMTDTVIHDLKNPLNHIIGSTGDKTIRQSGYTMLNIVMNILDINKAQSTKLNIHPENQSVLTLIDEAIEQVEFLAEQKNLNFEKLLPKEYIIKADRDLTVRTLINLFTNAIKYSPLNSKLTIQATENGNSLQIDVIDYGKGIPAENIETLFDEYTQIDAKKSGKVQSTGIGLTFCKIATEAQNARIDVCSVPGEKTQFSLIYPLVSVLEKETAIEEEAPKKGVLTEEERNMLRDILLALKELETYKAGEILILLQSIENPSENINNWMQKIKNAMYSSNNELYNKLIENEL